MQHPKSAFLIPFIKIQDTTLDIFLSEIEGNCEVSGSSHAEQKHSYVASQFSDCAVMTLEKNVQELCTRKGRLMTQRREEQSKWYITHYTPTLSIPIFTQMELKAQKILDKKPFHQLFMKKMKAMQFLKVESVTNTEGISYQTLPLEETLSSASSSGLVQHIWERMRCMCLWRVAYEAQCEHELLIDQDFLSDK